MAMQLNQSMRPEMRQRQILTPRMIQSMEILQLPYMELEQRIEQELQANPILERVEERLAAARPAARANVDALREDRSEYEKPLTMDEQAASPDEFRRLSHMMRDLANEEFVTNGSFRRRSAAADDERDGKREAIDSTPARTESLAEYLLRQWQTVDCPPAVHDAGRAIIEHLDADGYLRADLQTVRQAMKNPASDAEMEEALHLVQQLDPPGVAARNLRECLLLQLAAIEKDPDLAEGHDFDLERRLLNDHLDDLKNNRYPQISRALNREIPEIKAAVKRLGRLSLRPGKLIGPDEAHAVIPDAEIYLDERTGQYEVRMRREDEEGLRLNRRYLKMLNNPACAPEVRKFLGTCRNNARWLLDAIRLRGSTLRRVIRVVADAQRDFFEKGPEYLKPLPMGAVADRLGIHVATVSRAVADKWVQTPRGVMPLRKFFSGGTTSADGTDMSWDAVKEKMRAIVDAEDKHNPLSDEEIAARLKEQGINLARRTVAKYRKALGIPPMKSRIQY